MAGDDPSQIHSQAHTTVDLLGLDHVALAVADPDAMSAFLCGHVGMRELARSGESVAVGADARSAGVRLVPAPGPREAAALARLVLRVGDLQRAVASLPAGTEIHEEAPDIVTFEGPEGLGLGFTPVAGGGTDYDVDHLIVRVADPEETRIALAELGFVPRGEGLHISDKRIDLEQLPAWSDRPLLDHIAVRVGSIDAVTAQAQRRGLAIEEAVDDATLTIVLPGPERLRLNFVERTSD